MQALKSSAFPGRASRMPLQPALRTSAMPCRLSVTAWAPARSLRGAVHVSSHDGLHANRPLDLAATSSAPAATATPSTQPSAAPSPASHTVLPPWAGRAARLACLAVAAASLAALLSPAAALAAGDAATAAAGGSGNPLSGLVSFILHLDKHLAALIQQHGANSVYGLLFAIVFAETGLVLTPFLPGDSLLFAAGAFAGEWEGGGGRGEEGGAGAGQPEACEWIRGVWLRV
mgnify:CR=1 FL=1